MSRSGARRLLLGLAAAALVAILPGIGRAQSVVSAADSAWTAELRVRELSGDVSLRIRLFHDPAHVPVPPSAGTLVLVQVDQALGEKGFFVPSDLAFELGSRRIYRAEVEQASDLFGQSLGGRVRAGDVQTGFLMIPAAAELGRFLAETPDSVVVRYAHHRGTFRPASTGERTEWREAFPAPILRAGLNAWWEWVSTVDAAPEMSEGEAVLFAERLFPGQGHILARENISATALRNTILRVGERRLLHGPVTQRVAPGYPAAARQAGAGGLVVVLAYVSPEGRVEDALVLASNTVHLLNVAALRAALEWRFAPVRPGGGEPTDGWRLLPFHFLLEGESASAATSGGGGGETGIEPPRILKRVEPEYPEKAYRARVAGTVVYRVTVDARGKMVRALLEKSVDPRLDAAALSALERMLFAPGSRDGVPVEGELLVPFTFGEPEPR